MKNDILMFHCMMRAMPLDADMSVNEICHAVEQTGGSFPGEAGTVRSPRLQID